MRVALIIGLLAAVQGGLTDRGRFTALLDNRYLSTEVERHGEPLARFDATTVRVAFEHRRGYNVIRWRADCNDLGGRVRTVHHRLQIRGVEGSEIACGRLATRQDRWLLRFFESGPRWRLDRDRGLLLTAPGRTIELDQPAAVPPGDGQGPAATRRGSRFLKA